MDDFGQREVVFDHSIDGLFQRSLRNKMTQHCRERLRQAGLDLSTKLKPMYPRLQFYEFLEIARQEIYPGRSRDEGLFQLGYGLLGGYEETFLGKAVLAVVKLLGPRRTLGRATQSLQSSNNYIASSLQQLGPTSFALTLNQVSGAPTYFAGVIQRGIELAGGAQVKVEPQPVDGPGCVYIVQWQDKR